MKSVKKIKTIVALFVLFCFSFFMISEASALAEQVYITIKVNGSVVKVDALPYVKDNRTFVPVRFVSESLGAEVEWIQEEKKVIITQDDKVLEMWQDSNELVVNGEKQLMDTFVEVSDGRTMLPVRFAAENLGCTVEWHDPTYSVLIYKEDAEVPAVYLDDRSYTDDDIIWLSRIVSVEGRGLSVEGKVAIANVVLNRKKSPRFPNTIYDVIFDSAYCVQFPPAHKEGFREIVPVGSCVIAAKMALEGINNIDEALFFNNVPFKSKSSDELYKVIEGEYFYY